LGPTAGRLEAAQDDAAKIAALIKADSFLAAAKLADGLLARGSLAPETEAICGLAVLKAGRVDAAEAILKRVEAKCPGLPEAALGLGLAARIRNDSAAAVARLRRGSESAGHYEEACRCLWRTAIERGVMDEIRATRDFLAERFKREGLPAPDWLSNGLAQLEGFAGSGLFQMDKTPDHVAVPLLSGGGPTIRMVSMRINGKGSYRFDIDSAAADFMVVSPLLAEELGLKLNGSSQAIGVGTGSAPVRFSRLDRIDFAGITFRNVPVRVADLHVFRGLKKGLFGTGLLKRFNVTIDVRAGVMDLFALDRPEMLAARIDKAKVAGEVLLWLFDATMVTASMAGAPEGLFILDTAAATNLIDTPFFAEHIKPRLDPARIIAAGIQGAQGVQRVNQVNGLEVRLGPIVFDNQQVNEFSMSALNSATGRYAAGLLGNPLLWPYRSHYDFKNGRLILERY
jgi:predicted aspartyl protease